MGGFGMTMTPPALQARIAKERHLVAFHISESYSKTPSWGRAVII
jgi:hypothetical protein